MGLDMYLERRTYTSQTYRVEYQTNPKAFGHVLEMNFPDEALAHIDRLKVTDIVERIGYWRKANAIHLWFVKNCADGRDECQDIEVTIDQLTELRDLCVQVIDGSQTVNDMVYVGSHSGPATGGRVVKDFEPGQVIVNPELAAELLPTGAGFFFGSTDYDQWYLQDLEHTRDLLSEVIDWHQRHIEPQKTEPNHVWVDYVYRASW